MPPPTQFPTTNTWGVPEFDDAVAKEDRKRKEFEKFVKSSNEYTEKLEGIVEALEQSLVSDMDPSFAPMRIDLVPYESLTVLQLINTKNKTFNKVLMALSSLCMEVETLKNEAVTIFFPPLVTYGETLSDAAAVEGESQERMGRMLSFFQDTAGFVKRVYDVVCNILQQLGALYVPGKHNKVNVDMTGVHHQLVFEKLADALGLLMTMDTIVSSNERLVEDWSRYGRMMSLVRSDPSRVGLTGLPQFYLLEKMLLSLGGTLLEGNIFNACMSQRFDVDGLVNVTRNTHLAAEMDTNVRNYFDYLNLRVGETNETDQRQRLIGFLGLYSLFTRFYLPTVDKKFFKQIFLLVKRVPIVHLYGNVSFRFDDFLKTQLRAAVTQSGLKMEELKQSMGDRLKRLDDTVGALFDSFYSQACTWMVRMQSELTETKLPEVLTTKLAILLQGVMLAASVSNTIKDSISSHLALNAPINKRVARCLARLIELLKAIEDTYARHNIPMARIIPAIQQLVNSRLYKLVTPVRDRISVSKRLTDSVLDTLAALDLFLNAIDGSATRDRLVTAELALAQAMQQKVFSKEEVDEIRGALRKVEMVTSIQSRVADICRTEYIFWNRQLLPTYFSELYESPQDAYCLQYFMSAIEDARPLLQRSVSDPKELLEAYERDITELLFSNIVRQLADDIEKDLIWCSHPAEMRQEDRNPFRVVRRDLTPFLRIPPLHFFDKTINIKTHVTHQLDKNLYNLTALRSSSWTAFADMRNLAFDKYGIEMTEVHLPVHTVEQGADVLEIMRNIDSFVKRYNYNLNIQLFVEKSSNSKHLETINIRHVANSIRTHGTGMMNTTINVTYQFLRKKFKVFSEFLYDDHIKSRLIKEARYFRDNKAQLNQKFPYEVADKFNRTIRELGAPDGLTYVDQFRLLITSIGNAMGYVRMMRSGGLHYSSKAITFVPDVAEIIGFEELITEEGMSQEDAVAGRLLDDAVENLSKNFSEATDYFQSLVNVFSKEFRDTKNVHLKNFFVIIPAMTINYVETLLATKERIDKKRNDGATFTDDGFAMGLAYILKLLGQNDAFDSLHWFSSVNEYYLAQVAKIDAGGKKRGEQQQALLVSKKRLQLLQREYDLLYVTLTGARIFFREEGEHFATATVEKKGSDNAESAADAGTVTTTVDVATGGEA